MVDAKGGFVLFGVLYIIWSIIGCFFPLLWILTPLTYLIMGCGEWNYGEVADKKTTGYLLYIPITIIAFIFYILWVIIFAFTIIGLIISICIIVIFVLHIHFASIVLLSGIAHYESKEKLKEEIKSEM
eukprot:TRINITY_DN937_c0_g1_i1.p1 TRINITY_DN937_c0_g1~~TRINITY_DN937_c0_g1_i1.p1  ORF type:complete len:144 (-),score=8.96 TRINITY_DN937_c0_g1_i1:61-444(-)